MTKQEELERKQDQAERIFNALDNMSIMSFLRCKYAEDELSKGFYKMNKGFIKEAIKLDLPRLINENVKRQRKKTL